MPRVMPALGWLLPARSQRHREAKKTPLGFFALRISMQEIEADLVNHISELRNRVTLKAGDRVTLIRE
jgi:hypothetical protein